MQKDDCQITDNKVITPIIERRMLYPWSIFHLGDIPLIAAVCDKSGNERNCIKIYSLSPSCFKMLTFRFVVKHRLLDIKKRFKLISILQFHASPLALLTVRQKPFKQRNRQHSSRSKIGIPFLPFIQKPTLVTSYT
ncbi:hypothetical protein Tsp_10754 [Trichinella spiralis]|uniref:hypothetical protein n=1 Tax=Trichinella spiralis TaxID=6334 RepID=UPI0001EFD30F|nr:hypothetical protein Tsp_10754 [Trichinella spiralis]